MEYRIKQVGDNFYPQYKRNYWIPIGVWHHIMKDVYNPYGGLHQVREVFHSLDDANNFMKIHIHQHTTTIYDVVLDIKDERRKKLEKLKKIQNDT